MSLLKLIADLGLNKSAFDAGLAAAEKQTRAFGSNMAASLKATIGAAFATAAVMGTKGALNFGGALKDLSDRLGLSVEAVQEFSLAAKLGGADSETFAKAVEKIRLAMVEAAASGKNPLESLGVTLEQMKSGDAVGVLRGLAGALEDFSGNADQTKALFDVFGRGAGPMINMLRELKNASGSNVARLSQSEVDQLDAAGDFLTRIKNNLAVQGAKALSTVLRFFGQKIEPPVRLDFDKVAAVASEEAKRLATLEDIRKVEAETADIVEKTRFDQLSREEKLNDLLERRAELNRQLLFVLDGPGGGGDLERARLRKQIAQIDAVAAGLPAEPAATMQHGILPRSGGLAGVFVGELPGSRSPLVEIKGHLAALEQLARGRGLRIDTANSR